MALGTAFWLAVVSSSDAVGVVVGLGLVGAALTGAAVLVPVLLGPALLKTRFGVDEVVTTLLLNFIMLLFVSMLLEGALKDPMALGWPQSRALVPAARLPRATFGLRVHWGFAIALIAAVLVAVTVTPCMRLLRVLVGEGMAIEPVGMTPSEPTSVGVRYMSAFWAGDI